MRDHLMGYLPNLEALYGPVAGPRPVYTPPRRSAEQQEMDKIKDLNETSLLSQTGVTPPAPRQLPHDLDKFEPVGDGWYKGPPPAPGMYPSWAALLDYKPFLDEGVFVMRGWDGKTWSYAAGSVNSPHRQVFGAGVVVFWRMPE